jgi:hypothetical protein
MTSTSRATWRSRSRWSEGAGNLLAVTTPLRELLAAVPTLNDPAEPFTYTVEGDTIVGTWDIVKATSLYPTEIEHVDKKYAITVELDEEKSTFDFNERKSSSKEFRFSFGGVNKTDEGVSLDPVVYSFETSRIKEPLFTFLEQHGWKRKKGLLGGLFSR